MQFKVLNDNEFEAVKKDFDYNFYQSSEWAELKSINGWKHEITAVFDEERPILICVILMRKILFGYLCYAPRGPLLVNNAELKTTYKFFLENIVPYLKKKKGFVFKFDPYIKMRERNRAGEAVSNWDNSSFVEFLEQQGCIHHGYTKGYSDDAQFRWSYALDINGKNEDMLKGDMNYRCKRSIKRAEKYPMEIVDVNDENMNDFMDIMNHTAERHFHTNRSENYYKTLNSVLGEKAKLKMIYLNKTAFLEKLESGEYNVKDNVLELINNDKRNMIPLTAAVFILDKNQMNYVYGGTYAYYFSLNAQYRLQMEMIRLSMDLDLKAYDFGGIPGVFDSNSEQYKIYDYKRGYGGHVIEYIGEFDLPINRVYFSLYKNLLRIYKRIK